MQTMRSPENPPTMPPDRVFDPSPGHSKLAQHPSHSVPRRNGTFHRRLWALWQGLSFWRRVPLPWRVVLVFVLLIALSNTLLDHFGGGLAAASDEWGALNQIDACERRSMAPDILVMGSSHAQAGIASPILESEVAARLDRPIVTCNVGVTTSVPMQDYYMLRHMVEDGLRPKFLIYVTSDYAFNSSVADLNPPVLANMPYFTRIGDLPDIMATPLGQAQQDHVAWPVNEILGRLFRGYADRHGFQVMLCRLKPNFGPCPDILPSPEHPVASPATPLRAYPLDAAEGWYPLPEVTETSLRNSQYQYQQWLRDYQVAPDALNYLGRIITLARDCHMGIVLLNMPVLPQQLTFYAHPDGYLTYVDAIYAFAQAHGVPFYDEGLGFDDDLNDFADTNHLNYWGALAFTGWLGVHVVAPEFQRQVAHRGS